MLVKFAQWVLRKENIKRRKAQLKQLGKEKVKALVHYQQVLNFTKLVNEKICKNRTERKAFWKKVESGEPMVENVLNQIIDTLKKEINAIEEMQKPKKKVVTKINTKDKSATVSAETPITPDTKEEKK